MKNRKTYCFLLLVFCFGCACKKLPKETHRGRSMMACYVNGEKWVAKDKIIIFDKHPFANLGGITSSGSSDPNPFAKYNSIDNTMNLLGSSKKDDQGGIGIYIINFSGVGSYQLKDIKTPTSSATYTTSEGGARTYDNYSGLLNVKYFSDKVVAGTFSFEGFNVFNGKRVNVTDGRFDIEYSTK